MLHHSQVKLGRRPFNAEHMRALPTLVDHLDVDKMSAPPLSRWWNRQGGVYSGAEIPIAMFGNDTLGDCTCATLGHFDQITAAQIGQKSNLTADDVIQLYEGSGYKPGDGSTDNGWQNIDAARAAMKLGWIEALAKFDPHNKILAQIVINEFGMANIGIDLPLSAQDQMGKVWDVAPAGVKDSRYDRCSWGGHAAGIVAYSADEVLIATWGGFQRATWPFVFEYTSEGLVLFSPRWRRVQLTPSGLRFDELLADIARFNNYYPDFPFP